jgi:hypothetical protein
MYHDVTLYIYCLFCSLLSHQVGVSIIISSMFTLHCKYKTSSMTVNDKLETGYRVVTRLPIGQSRVQIPVREDISLSSKMCKGSRA